MARKDGEKTFHDRLYSQRHVLDDTINLLLPELILDPMGVRRLYELMQGFVAKLERDWEAIPRYVDREDGHFLQAAVIKSFKEIEEGAKGSKRYTIAELVGKASVIVAVAQTYEEMAIEYADRQMQR